MSGGPLILQFTEVHQPVGTFYSCVVPAQDLLRICTFDFRKIEQNNGIKEFLGIQRKLNKERVKEIRRYIGTEDASFPTSIVLSVDERCAHMIDVDGRTALKLTSYENPEDSNDVVPITGIATIIDGQHRLKAFDGAPQNWDLSVNMLIGADPGTRAMIFSKVNLAQTKVNKSLVYDLFSLDKERSPEKTAHEIAVNLNDMVESPFHNKIKRLGSATDGVFGETLSQATVVKGILPLITKDSLLDRDIGRRVGHWPVRGQVDFEKRIFYPAFQANRDEEILLTLLNFFNAAANKWDTAWLYTGRGAVLPKTNGFNGLIRFLRDAYLHVTSTPRVVEEREFAEIFDRSKLKNEDFTVDNFKPGSSGSAELYRRLLETLS